MATITFLGLWFCSNCVVLWHRSCRKFNIFLLVGLRLQLCSSFLLRNSQLVTDGRARSRHAEQPFLNAMHPVELRTLEQRPHATLAYTPVAWSWLHLDYLIFMIMRNQKQRNWRWKMNFSALQRILHYNEACLNVIFSGWIQITEILKTFIKIFSHRCVIITSCSDTFF